MAITTAFEALALFAAIDLPAVLLVSPTIADCTWRGIAGSDCWLRMACATPVCRSGLVSRPTVLSWRYHMSCRFTRLVRPAEDHR